MHKRWNAPHKLLTHCTLWLIFKFETKEIRDKFLQGGLYITYGCLLYLELMSQCSDFQPEAQNKIPLWMQMYSLLVDCWTTTGLIKLVSCVGTLLFSNRFTRTRKWVISFAQVLVEVDVTKPLPQHILVILSNSKDLEMTLKFESTLNLCTTCRHLGYYKC